MKRILILLIFLVTLCGCTNKVTPQVSELHQLTLTEAQQEFPTIMTKTSTQVERVTQSHLELTPLLIKSIEKNNKYITVTYLQEGILQISFSYLLETQSLYSITTFGSITNIDTIKVMAKAIVQLDIVGFDAIELDKATTFINDLGDKNEAILSLSNHTLKSSKTEYLNFYILME